MLVASYHILLGQTPTSHPFTLSQRTCPVEEQSTPMASPVPVPKQSPRPKRWHPSPDPVESMPVGGTTSKTTLEGPPSSKWWEIPPWNKALKLCSMEAFSQDSDLVKEARRISSQSIPSTLLWRAPMISQKYLGRWPQVLGY